MYTYIHAHIQTMPAERQVAARLTDQPNDRPTESPTDRCTDRPIDRQPDLPSRTYSTRGAPRSTYAPLVCSCFYLFRLGPQNSRHLRPAHAGVRAARVGGVGGGAREGGGHTHTLVRCSVSWLGTEGASESRGAYRPYYSRTRKRLLCTTVPGIVLL